MNLTMKLIFIFHIAFKSSFLRYDFSFLLLPIDHLAAYSSYHSRTQRSNAPLATSEKNLDDTLGRQVADLNYSHETEMRKLGFVS